jgi:hypothetical protein
MHQNIQDNSDQFKQIQMPSGLRAFAPSDDITPANRLSGDPDSNSAHGQQPSIRDLIGKKGQSPSAAPTFTLVERNGVVRLKIDHEVREILSSLDSKLSEFITQNMHERAKIGLNYERNEPADMEGVMECMKCSRFALDRLSQDRGDGMDASLVVRGVASDATLLLEKEMIELVVSGNHERVAKGDLQQVLSSFAELRHSLKRLIQHFDAKLLEYVRESGALGGASGETEAKSAA